MQDHEEISRREALGLFKAVAALGAGLMVSKSAAGQGDAFTVKQSKVAEGRDYECRFYVTSLKRSSFHPEPAMFSVKLPWDMVRMLADDPTASVQIKFWSLQHKDRSIEWGSAQLKLRQGIIQSKGFIIQDKWHTVEQKTPTPGGPVPVPYPNEAGAPAPPGLD